jgi:hypothetical protein
MSTRHTITTLAAAIGTVLAAAVASAAAPPSHATLVIRHQVRGCHSWSVDGGAYRASQTLTLRRGGSIVVTDNDVMPHRLIQTAGPAVRFANLATPFTGMGMRGHAAPGAMRYMGAATKVVFTRPGVYRFVTRAGEDYVPMKTVGEDNVLRLIVRVK